MSRKNKKYIPDKRYNSIVQNKILSKEVEKLAIDIDNHKKLIDAISKSHSNHISYLSNFARHDIKNAMLSMDSIVVTTSPGEFTEEKIKSLHTFIELVMDTLDNFAKLVPYDNSGSFAKNALLIAVEMLTRSDMKKKKNVKLVLEFDRSDDSTIELPFQPLLQMINNLILNATKSMEVSENKIIKISSFTEDSNLNISISDTGSKILEPESSKVFNYGFSTTGGSGIGLYHAKYICDLFEGNIALVNAEDELFTKTFKLRIPCERQ